MKVQLPSSRSVSTCLFNIMLWVAGLTVTCALLQNCLFTNDSLAGGGTSETEAALAGTFRLPDGQPAVGARVRIHASDFLLENAIGPELASSIVTDQAGSFRYTPSQAGPLTLEVLYSDKLGAVVQTQVAKSGLTHVDAKLVPFGKLSVKLVTVDSNARYHLQVFGLERLVLPDSEGLFKLELPPGKYNLRISTEAGSYSPLLVDTVTVKSLQEIRLDSLQLPHLSLGLLGHWTFDEGQGTLIADAAAANPEGHMFGGSWLTGKLQGGISFSNGQGFCDLGISKPDPYDFGAEGNFTFAAWIKVGNPIPNRGHARRIVSKVFTNGRAYLLRVFPDGSAALSVRNTLDTSWAYTQKSRKTVADGQWHYVAGIRDRGWLRIFVDGTEEGASLADSVNTDPTLVLYDDHRPGLYSARGLEEHLLVGAVLDGWEGFDGSIDDLRIYNRALRAEEIRSLAQP